MSFKVSNVLYQSVVYCQKCVWCMLIGTLLDCPNDDTKNKTFKT